MSQISNHAQGLFPALPVIQPEAEKKKKTKEDWDTLLWTKVDKTNPPRVTRHLRRQTMCGACKFKCCSSFFVELSVEEAQKHKLPMTWRQQGGCFCNTPTGCRLGSERPSFCKIYPVQIDFERNYCYCPHWALVSCPVPKDFEFIGKEDGKYVYRKRSDLKGPKKNNIQDEIRLNHPIEQWPDILAANSEGLDEIYGEGYSLKLREQLNALLREDGLPV